MPLRIGWRSASGMFSERTLPSADPPNLEKSESVSRTR